MKWMKVVFLNEKDFCFHNFAMMNRRGKANVLWNSKWIVDFKSSIEFDSTTKYSSFEPRIIQEDEEKMITVEQSRVDFWTTCVKSQFYATWNKLKKSYFPKVLFELVFRSFCKKRKEVQSSTNTSKLVDPASDHILRSKIKPCMSKTKQVFSESAYGSLQESWLILALFHNRITVVIQGLSVHQRSFLYWDDCIC